MISVQLLILDVPIRSSPHPSEKLQRIRSDLSGRRVISIRPATPSTVGLPPHKRAWSPQIQRPRRPRGDTAIGHHKRPSDRHIPAHSRGSAPCSHPSTCHWLLTPAAPSSYRALPRISVPPALWWQRRVPPLPPPLRAVSVQFFATVRSPCVFPPARLTRLTLCRAPRRTPERGDTARHRERDAPLPRAPLKRIDAARPKGSTPRGTWKGAPRFQELP